MSKNLRIKRYYKSVYSKKFKPLKIAVFVMIVALVFFLGWSIYPAIRNTFVKPSETPESSSSEQQSSSENEISDPSSGSEHTDSSEISENSQQESSVPENVTDGIRAIYVSSKIINDRSALDNMLSSAKSAGFNAVYITLKDGEGYLNYKSSVNLARKSMSDTAYDLAEKVEYFKANGFDVIGDICSFHDHIAPKTDRSAAIHYLDYANYLWLDEASNKGGRPWLNPYADKAAQYLIDLSAEAAQAGIKTIIFSGFSFPTKIGIEYANYGENVSDTEHNTLIKRMKEVSSALEQYDAKAVFFSEGYSVLGGNQFIYRGDPLDIAVNAFSASIFQSDIISNKLAKKLGISDSDLDPYECAYVSMSTILSSLDPSVEFIPILQAFSDSYFTSSTESVSELIRAVNDCSLNSYILYDTDCSYYFLKGSSK
ncbi:MAG: hypothetical protein J5874_02985 [Oscillospiraceae bacterium]|nr:hypothetical protein [Oscillospiraceae bacterium]